jgi:hypothetical protein
MKKSKPQAGELSDADIKALATELLKSPVFLRKIVPSAAAVLLIGYFGTVKYIAEKAVQQVETKASNLTERAWMDVSNQIVLKLQETNVQSTMQEVAGKQATNLMMHSIAPALSNLQKSVDTAQSALAEQNEKISSMASKTEALGLVITNTHAALEEFKLVLRSNLAELQMKTQDRTITPEQRETFIRSLTNAPKGPVMMGSRGVSRESSQYFEQVKTMIQASGYTVPLAVNYRDNLVWLNGNDSIAFFVQSISNAPPYVPWLGRAFQFAGISVTFSTNVSREFFGIGPAPKSNEVLILVTEKP